MGAVVIYLPWLCERDTRGMAKACLTAGRNAFNLHCIGQVVSQAMADRLRPLDQAKVSDVVSNWLSAMASEFRSHGAAVMHGCREATLLAEAEGQLRAGLAGWRYHVPSPSGMKVNCFSPCTIRLSSYGAYWSVSEDSASM